MMPEIAKGDMLFTLKEITYIPETPRLKEPFSVKGKVTLFGIPFLAPIWVLAKVTYPEAWWEEIVPLIGSPTVGEGQMAIGGDFEINFPRGFDREGEFLLDVEVHAGPTYTIDKITLPPFPPVATEKTTFLVAGEVPPEEVGFKSFRILSYSKNTGPPVTPPGVLELEIGDRCRVNVGFDHMDGAVTGKFHAAIWQKTLIDPHDQVLNADKSFSVPSSPDWQPFENYIDIPITSAISPGTEYGLYVKIMGITGGDIFTEYLANVITIIGIPTEGIIENLAIVGYDTPVEAGATCKVAVNFDYRGPRPEDANLYVALGKIINIAFFGWDIAKWFDEEAHGEVKLVGIEESEELRPYAVSVDIPIPSGLSSGEYSLYAKITGRDVSDYISEPLENVVTIIGPPPPSDLYLPAPGFEATPGTYDLGDRVPWTMAYQYKGKAQGGYLTISLGTGVYPSFFTKHTFPRVAVSFDEAMDWAPSSLSGNFTLPTTLEPGQMYNVRATLETADGAKETDTDWGVITITEVPVPPKADIADFDFTATPGTYDLGAKVPYNATYKYKGKAQGGYLTISLGTGVYPSFSTKHTYPRVAVSFDEAMDWAPSSLSGNFTLPTTLEPGQMYNVRATLETADGAKETDTDWGVITITEVPVPPPSDLYLPAPGFEATPGTYDLGDRVPWTMVYQYKGKAQGGYLTISLGTGVYPSFFTKHTFPRVAVSFDEAMDWTPSYLTGSFTLPTTLEAGQTYSVRAKLETADGKRETDTDWGVITITEVAPPKEYTLTIGVSPWGAGTVTGAGTYRANVWATCYASPATGYEFDHWGGDATGTSQSLRVLMDRDKEVIAYFREKVVPEYTLTIQIDPPAAGWVTKYPDKTRYSYGERVKLTAHSAPGYSFQSWWVGDEFLSSGNPITFMVVGDHTITAYFLKTVVPGYTLTIQIRPLAAGWVTKEPDKTKYSYGEIVKLTAREAPGYSFQSWWVGDEFLSSGNPINFMIVSDRTITAYYL